MFRRLFHRYSSKVFHACKNAANKCPVTSQTLAGAVSKPQLFRSPRSYYRIVGEVVRVQAFRLGVVILLLGGLSPAHAFLGDDEPAVSDVYGVPRQTGSTPSMQTYSYQSKSGYRIEVSFESGVSAAETFHKLVGDKGFSAGEIRDFLHAYTFGKEWVSVPAKAGEQSWHCACASATATYFDSGAAPYLTIVSDFFGTGKPIPPKVGRAALTPVPRPKIVATIQGEKDKTSDPFAITSQHGFSVEYEVTAGLLSLTVLAAGNKQQVGQADLSCSGHGVASVEAGPGSYYMTIAASGPYKVTVVQ